MYLVVLVCIWEIGFSFLKRAIWLGFAARFRLWLGIISYFGLFYYCVSPFVFLLLFWMCFWCVQLNVNESSVSEFVGFLHKQNLKYFVQVLDGLNELFEKILRFVWYVVGVNRTLIKFNFQSFDENIWLTLP